MKDSHAVVLPGVGSFDYCLNALQKQDLLEACRDFIRSGRLFLGICVGYQALFEKSEEFNSCAAGLGVFPGKVVRFAEKPGLKIPQIGWNQIEVVRADCPILRGIPSGSYVYFVHSFFPEPIDPSVVAARTTYGERVVSAGWQEKRLDTPIPPREKPRVRCSGLQKF